MNPKPDYYQYHTSDTLEFGHSQLRLAVIDRYNGRRRMFRLTEPFIIMLRDPKVYVTPFYKLTIPAGYETDLASIPLFATVLVGDRACFAEESVVHDWLCDHGAERFHAHAIMRLIMKARRHPRWKRFVIFYALMLVGYGSTVFIFVTRLFRRRK
jgi:hypothetical protein